MCSTVRGRLSLFSVQWQSLTADPWILNIVKFGYFIDFLRLPVQDKLPSEIIMDDEKSKICDAEVRTLLQKGAIVLASDETGFVSNFFVVPKKTAGKFRPIFNLKQLNFFVSYQHFKMEGIDHLKH